jgi:DNA-binding response OmpR family regulator
MSRTILMLVDKDELRDLLTNDLAGAGYRVITTASGGEVLPLAKEENPDLILLDLLVRHPQAFDVAMVLKRDSQTVGIPVLFLTSVDDPQVGVRMGAIDFMVRTVGTGALLSTINTILHSGISPTSRVLIIEPDDALRENMVMMIQAHGYRVIVATTPEEGLALAERVDPEMILVNASLAQERDYWLLRGLRRLSEVSEIVMMADAFSDEEVRTAISRGASGISETGKLPDLLNRVRGKGEGENAVGEV